jgi:hypothetical protein
MAVILRETLILLWSIDDHIPLWANADFMMLRRIFHGYWRAEYPTVYIGGRGARFQLGPCAAARIDPRQ